MPLHLINEKRNEGLSLKIKICCCNCKYYYATPEKSYCTIDNQNIPVELSRIFKCKAFEIWFGSVE